jgi:cytochrome P450
MLQSKTRFVPPFPARVPDWRSPYRMFVGESQSSTLYGWSEQAFEIWHRRIRLLGVVSHIVNHPDAIRRVLLDNKDNYVRPRLVRRILSPLLGNGLLTSDGDDWSKQRKIVAPTFAPSALAGMTKTIAEVAEKQVASWAREPRQRDMAEQATSATMSVIADALFSSDVRLTSPDAHRLIHDVLSTVGAPSITNLLNLPRIDITTRQKRETRGRNYLRTSLGAMVDERGPDGGADDFFGGLIRALYKLFPAVEAREIAIDNAVTFYVAGHETTAVTLTWTIYLLAAQPALQERAREEAIAAIAGDPATLADRTPLLRQIVDESLRLYAPILRIDREALADDRLGNIEIKRGELVTILPWAVHRHKQLWDDPDAFDIDRFSGENKAKLDRHQYIPFGAGPRICVGARFAIVEALIILAHWLAAARFETPSDHEIAFTGTAVGRPKGGMPLIVRPTASATSRP